MKEKSEEWLPIPGYIGRYSVSDRGNVLSMDWNRTGLLKIMRPNICNGYQRLNLHKDGVKKYEYVHKLVMEAFIGQRPKRLHINHKNGIKTDNRLVNLEYCTAIQNAQHATSMGVVPHGETHYAAKLTESNVIEIKRKLSAGVKQDQIAKEYGITQGTVSMIANGKRWRHITVGTLQ